MWLILVSLLVGVVIGLLNILPRKIVKYNSRFQQIGVILLIFSMGASIGSNREILRNLESMGFKALIFACLTSILSIAAVYAVSKRFFREDRTK